MLVSNGFTISIGYEVKFVTSVGVTSFSRMVEWSSVGCSMIA